MPRIKYNKRASASTYAYHLSMLEQLPKDLVYWSPELCLNRIGNLVQQTFLCVDLPTELNMYVLSYLKGQYIFKA